MPPVFWTLATHRSQDRLAEALRLLSLQSKIDPIVQELKRLDEDNVASLLSELEIFRLLRLRYTTVTWKPRIGGRHAKRPDLSFVDARGRLVVLEVMTVRRSLIDSEEQRALYDVTSFINRAKFPYEVSYELKNRFCKRHVQKCCAFLRMTMSRLLSREVDTRRINFVVGGQVLVTFTFTKTPGGGGWLSGTRTGREIVEGGRIKHKLKRKLEKFQLPKGTEALKGFVLVVDELMHHQETVESAILGRVGVGVVRKENGLNVVWGRQSDGVVHDPEVGEILVKEVDFVASMRRPGGMFLEPLGMIVNADLNRVSRERACDLLWGCQLKGEKP